jgi:hypothetical protein
MHDLLDALGPKRRTRAGFAVAGVGLAAWVAASGSFASSPATRDCGVEADAIMARLAPASAVEGKSRLADAIRRQDARDTESLRSQLVEICDGREETPSRHVSLGCLAARRTERSALLQTLAERGDARSDDVAAALRAIA